MQVWEECDHVCHVATGRTQEPVVLCALVTSEKLCAQGPKGWDLLLDAEVAVQITDFGISRKSLWTRSWARFVGTPSLLAWSCSRARGMMGQRWTLGAWHHAVRLVSSSLPLDGVTSRSCRSVPRGCTGLLSTCPQTEGILWKSLVLNPTEHCTLKQTVKG